jgi:hypothetical protein
VMMAVTSLRDSYHRFLQDGFYIIGDRSVVISALEVREMSLSRCFAAAE